MGPCLWSSTHGRLSLSSSSSSNNRRIPQSPITSTHPPRLTKDRTGYTCVRANDVTLTGPKSGKPQLHHKRGTQPDPYYVHHLFSSFKRNDTAQPLSAAGPPLSSCVA
jgi:hypothetical protein